jgi:hypothetical protein
VYIGVSLTRLKGSCGNSIVAVRNHCGRPCVSSTLCCPDAPGEHTAQLLQGLTTQPANSDSNRDERAINNNAVSQRRLEHTNSYIALLCAQDCKLRRPTINKRCVAGKTKLWGVFWESPASAVNRQIPTSPCCALRAAS